MPRARRYGHLSCVIVHPRRDLNSASGGFVSWPRMTRLPILLACLLLALFAAVAAATTSEPASSPPAATAEATPEPAPAASSTSGRSRRT